MALWPILSSRSKTIVPCPSSWHECIIPCPPSPSFTDFAHKSFSSFSPSLLLFSYLSPVLPFTSFPFYHHVCTPQFYPLQSVSHNGTPPDVFSSLLRTSLPLRIIVLSFTLGIHLFPYFLFFISPYRPQQMLAFIYYCL